MTGRYSPIAVLPCLFLAMPAEAARGQTRSPEATALQCPTSSAEEAEAEIKRLLNVTHTTGRAELLENLRRALCIAERNDGLYRPTIERRISLEYGGGIEAVEDALICRRAAQLTTYTRQEKTAALAATRTCLQEFEKRYPAHYDLQEEMLRTLSYLEAAISEDSNDPQAEALSRTANEKQNLHDYLYGIAPSLQQEELEDFDKGRKIFERLWTSYLSDAPQDASEIQEARLTGDAAKSAFLSGLASKRDALANIGRLRPAAWIWSLKILGELSSSLLAAGSSDVAGAASYLQQNVALWEKAVQDFSRTSYREAQGIAHLNLAIALRKIGNSRAAIEHGRLATAKLSPFAQRARLVDAVELLAAELAYVGRTTEAATVLFGWLAAYGDEKELFRNLTGRGRESPVYEDLAKHLSDVHASLADVLEAEERFGEAEQFRRLVLEARAELKGPGFETALIKAIYDLAINLAAQGRVEEAEAVARQRTRQSSDSVGRTLDQGLRAEKAAALALLLDRPDELERWIARAESELATFSFLPHSLVRRNKALLLASQGRTGEAARLLQELIADAEARGEHDRELSWLRAELARVQLRDGNSEAAIKLARQSIARSSQR